MNRSPEGLVVRDLHAWHGVSHTLHGVSLTIAPGEIVSLVGRNGAGRSTACLAMMGSLRATGSVRLGGAELMGRPPHEIARAGLGHVPEDRAVFPGLSVRQNLELGRTGRTARTGRSVDETLDRFPLLARRADTDAAVLSGGEKQMLAIARTLMGEPRIVLVDEPTEGLAPRLVDDIAALLVEIAREGAGVLLVEQKLTIALTVARRVLVMGRGRIVFEGAPDELRANEGVTREWLEV